MNLHPRESRPRPPKTALPVYPPMTEAKAQAWGEKLDRIRQLGGYVPEDPFAGRTSDEASEDELDLDHADHTRLMH